MSVCSLRWFAEDIANVGKWLVRETTDEVHARFWKAVERLDTHVQPSHVRRGWDGMLAEEAVERVRAEAQGVTECVEAPDYRGDADRMSAAYVPGSFAASAPVPPPEVADEGEEGLEATPQPRPSSPTSLSCSGSSSCPCDMHMRMAESESVVAQFNAAEDRRLRLAMDVQHACSENYDRFKAAGPYVQFDEVVEDAIDWIEVAYALQAKYTITPRK